MNRSKEEKTPSTLKSDSKGFRYSRMDTEDIKFSQKDVNSDIPQIRSATLFKLVCTHFSDRSSKIERITYEKYLDPNLPTTFLLTYRTHCTPAQLFVFLEKRFNAPPPPEIKDPEEWAKNGLHTIQLRFVVFSILEIF